VLSSSPVSQEIHGNRWALVAAELPGKTGQQCAQRWRHKVNPSIKKEKWTPEEDAQVRRYPPPMYSPQRPARVTRFGVCIRRAYAVYVTRFSRRRPSRYRH
jgi:hypothetical protein